MILAQPLTQILLKTSNNLRRHLFPNFPEISFDLKSKSFTNSWSLEQQQQKLACFVFSNPAAVQKSPKFVFFSWVPLDKVWNKTKFAGLCAVLCLLVFLFHPFSTAYLGLFRTPITVEK